MVRNVHERRLPAPPGALIDSLSGPDDRLWPRDRWPAMRFDRPLGAGARGGHGPVRYRVEEYEPGLRVRFRFEAPHGFDGYHEYTADGCTLRHTLVMRLRRPAWVTYPLFFRPLHDALIEDSLARAATELGAPAAAPGAPAAVRWSGVVRLLRWVAVVSRRRRAAR